MDDVSDLLRAISSLLWPTLLIVIVLVFRTELRSALRRLRRGKLFGQEIELDSALDELESRAREVAFEVPYIAPSPQEARVDSENEQRLLHEASASPRAAVMTLAADIEAEVRQFLAATGQLQRQQPAGFTRAIDSLELPEALRRSIREFWLIRNRIVHGHDAREEDVLRAMDSGLTILRAVRSIPREINTVYHPGVDVYSDPETTQLREGVKGVILETTSSDGGVTHRIFPTTRTHFERGKQVAWEWDLRSIWGESWYRDPKTEEILYAWTEAGEFVGRHIEAL